MRPSILLTPGVLYSLVPQPEIERQSTGEEDRRQMQGRPAACLDQGPAQAHQQLL